MKPFNTIFPFPLRYYADFIIYGVVALIAFHNWTSKVIALIPVLSYLIGETVRYNRGGQVYVPQLSVKSKSKS